MNSKFAIFTKKGAKFETTGRVLYGAVNTNTLFAGFGGTCEARNNGDAVVRYDQLANRWLVVMPIFGRAAARPDQPGVPKPGGPAVVSVPGVAGQPGRAAKLFTPPPAPPPQPAAPGAAAPLGPALRAGRERRRRDQRVHIRSATRSAPRTIPPASTTATNSCGRCFPTILVRPCGPMVTTCRPAPATM